MKGSFGGFSGCWQRSRNLTRNYKRNGEAAGVAATDVESFATDSEFDPSTAKSSSHEPRESCKNNLDLD